MTETGQVVSGQSPEAAYPLREISRRVQGWIERLGVVWVSGQLVEIRQSGSWCYMTLRDTGVDMSMSLQCPVDVYRQAGEPGTGTTVAAHVKVGYYEKNGRLALRAREIQVMGEGRLLAQLDARRRMLQQEGIFDAARKKPLPPLPGAIGIITAARSAAEQDVVVNIRQRWPSARLDVRHATMQGPRAAGEVISALRALDAEPSVEVIIIARGGGSLEDLLPFSDEGLVRAVAAARTPVVTAIGHETDMPLVDYAADRRASTPTGAARMVVPDVREELRSLASDLARVRAAVERRLTREQQWLDRERTSPVLRDPSATVDVHAQRLADLQGRSHRAITVRLQQESTAVEHLRTRVVAMSPQATLHRGYAILSHDGAGVTSVHNIDVGSEVLAYVADGTIDLTVTRTQEEL